MGGRVGRKGLPTSFPKNVLTRRTNSLGNSDYVIRRLDALSTAEKRLRELNLAEAPLNAISKFTWSFEASEVRPLWWQLARMVRRS